MAITCIKCPEELNTLTLGKCIFLAGGITGCPDWQKDFTRYWQAVNIIWHSIIVNPRRDSFNVEDPEITKAQIEWEYRHLLLTDLKVFWFPKETLCPIALFELAYCAQRGDDIIVGAHRDYKRRTDIIEQLKHLRPDIPIVGNLPDLASAANKFIFKKYGSEST